MRLQILVIMVLAVVLVSCAQADYTDILVTRVFDGDTLQLANGEKVRLIGIDTPEPEYSYANRGKEQQRSPEYYRQAKEATEFTRQLVEGKKVELEFDEERRDKYGRLLAYVWYEITPSSHLKDFDIPENFETDYRINRQGEEGTFVFLNATIIKSGHATVLNIPPNERYAFLFQRLYQEAREKRR